MFNHGIKNKLPHKFIIVRTPHIDQPKYQTLIKFYEKVEKATGDDILEVYTSIEEAPTHEDLEDTNEIQTAIIFDDVIMSKDLSEIENWYIGNFRHSNTSVFYKKNANRDTPKC